MALNTSTWALVKKDGSSLLQVANQYLLPIYWVQTEKKGKRTLMVQTNAIEAIQVANEDIVVCKDDKSATTAKATNTDDNTYDFL